MSWTQTVTGRAFNLLEPSLSPAHLVTEVGHGLSLIARFAGQTDTAYSVAQHSVIAAQAAEDETGDAELAAFVLLHDGHEFALGDQTGPGKRARRDLIRAFFGDLGADVAHHADMLVSRAETRLIDGIDRAIIEAAGLDFARFKAAAWRIAHFDQRALLTERQCLMRAAPKLWAVDDMKMPDGRPLQPLRPRKGRIKAWPPAKAAEAFADMLIHLCPGVGTAIGRAA